MTDVVAEWEALQARLREGMPKETALAELDRLVDACWRAIERAELVRQELCRVRAFLRRDPARLAAGLDDLAAGRVRTVE